MSVLPTSLTIKCGEGRTKQKVGVEHDINKIVARFKKTGTLPRIFSINGIITDDDGVVVDVSRVGDYQECCQRMHDAENAFMRYPSKVRRYFNNNVKQFADFMGKLNDPANVDEAVRLGLVTVRKEPEPKTTVNNDGKKAGE